MAGEQSKAQSRYFRNKSPSYEHLQAGHRRAEVKNAPKDVIINCGWGRLILGHTFASDQAIADALLAEKQGSRDIALYVSNPQVVLSYAPQSLFLDPSDTLRLWFNEYKAKSKPIPQVLVRRAMGAEDASAINAIYKKRRMVAVDPNLLAEQRNSKKLIYWVATDEQSGEVLGVVMGINHRKLFDDPDMGCSLWCLAVSPDCKLPGVGEALVRYLVEYFMARSCQYLDLSVMHDNEHAKALYHKLHFRNINTFAIKRKNAINEPLFMAPEHHPRLNPYAQIIVDEAQRRGIEVKVINPSQGLFSLSFGGRSIRCRESLTDLTSSVSMTMCANKWVTSQLFQAAGLNVPTCQAFIDIENAEKFLVEHQSIVVKPNDGEQGKGISIDIREARLIPSCVEYAKAQGSEVLLESYHSGDDLRVVVIGYEVVAAALRIPAEIQGDGQSDIHSLILKQSRRRMAATGGESRIPLDEATLTCLQDQGYSYDTILPKNITVRVRKTANLHTGGILVDVTDKLHPALAEAAIKAAHALEIPVTGVDMIVTSPDKPDYVIIEANERPGLANHEPRPTASKFVDLLFPQTKHLNWNQPDGRKG